MNCTMQFLAIQVMKDGPPIKYGEPIEETRMDILTPLNVLGFLGIVSVSYGCYMWDPVMGFIVAGVLLIVAATITSKRDL